MAYRLKNPVGRPLNPNALTKSGRAFTFFLEDKQMQWLDEQSGNKLKSKAEIIRELVTEAMRKTL